MRKLLILLPLLLLSACAGLAAFIAPAAQPFEQAAVTVAVASAVGTNPATQGARANQISGIAAQLLSIDNGATATLPLLESVVNAQIASLHLLPADVAVAQILTASLAAAIQAQITADTKGAISPNAQIAISTVLGWVITATKSYPS